MVDKNAITQVFDVLGPERVARGLATQRHTWADCFLARAYGARGELEGAIDDGLRGAAKLLKPPRALKVAKLLGVPPFAVVAVVDAFDHDTAEFRRLAEEWLELNRIGADSDHQVPVLHANK
ncbi:MAG: hypothetical protein ACREMF_07870 [Gemmatimonadales bacterium]